MDNNAVKIIQSPCISNCCLDEDDVCVGCYRHIDEIIGWHSADSQGRTEILHNAQLRKKVKKPPFIK